MNCDLGTYHVKVELKNACGYIHTWGTGRRFTEGNGGVYPLTADAIEPPYESEEALKAAIIYLYVEGNYSCDCNRALFSAEANGGELPEDFPCGEEIKLARLTLIKPDGSEEVLLDRDKPDSTRSDQ